MSLELSLEPSREPNLGPNLKPDLELGLEPSLEPSRELFEFWCKLFWLKRHETDKERFHSPWQVSKQLR